MVKAGLRAIYPGKRLSEPNKQHEKYPYLLRDKEIWLPNQVWATDITYIPMAKGFAYLVATWTGRAAKSWPGEYRTP